VRASDAISGENNGVNARDGAGFGGGAATLLQQPSLLVAFTFFKCYGTAASGATFKLVAESVAMKERGREECDRHGYGKGGQGAAGWTMSSLAI